MSNRIKVLISEVLKVPLEKVSNDLAFGDIPEWDSLAHMSIISALEKELNVVLDVEQVLDIEDVGDVLEIASQYK